MTPVLNPQTSLAAPNLGQQCKAALLLFTALTLITGALYPLAVTVAAQGLLPQQANGSLITHQNQAVGSKLIGQNFDQPQYLWGRLSAANHDGAASTGSNLGPLNPKLVEQVKGRIQQLRAADPSNTQPIPTDLVTASGSGLDSEISPAAAEWQVGRIARARGLSAETVRAAIAQATQSRQFGVLGEPRVNVLAANLALDTQSPSHNTAVPTVTVTAGQR